jgi:NAD(P)-dependent dehydrogenase (short-subunit alcohol dehydrogenase family)
VITKLEAVIMSEWNPLLLKGKKVLVTGAGGRIGSQIVAVMGREGATVAALDLTQELADRGAGASPGKAIALTADVTSADDADAAVATAENELGPLDILVNSHGIFPTVTLLELTPEKWDNIFAVNVRGNMLMSQAVARRWIKRNSPGSIVNISSGAATSARAGGAAYCGSKAALNMMTKVLAIELGQHDIRVNAVSPGLVLDSMLTRGATEAEPYVRAMLDAIPLGRTGHPREIAETVAFVSSDRSIWTTGAVFEVTGGSQAGRTHMPVANSLPTRTVDQSTTREPQTTGKTASSAQ